MGLDTASESMAVMGVVPILVLMSKLNDHTSTGGIKVIRITAYALAGILLGYGYPILVSLIEEAIKWIIHLK